MSRLCKLFLAFVSVAIAQARVKRDEPNITMPHFNIDLLDPSFASYNLPQCTSDVNECMKNLHTEAIKCVVKLRANPAAAHCMATDEQVKSGHEQFQKNSFKWHKSVELCLKGQECSGDHCLQSSPPEPVPARSVRHDAVAAAAAGDVEQFRQENKQCFDGVEATKAACREKAASCEQFSHCYGEGPLPTEPRLATWYYTIKNTRRETSIVGHSTMRQMFECMDAAALMHSNSTS